MFLATGDARYLDLVERILYNGFLSGVSLSGDRFFYTNPLASEGGVERSPYFEVACCPANLARMMALLPTFLYAVGAPPAADGKGPDPDAEEIVVGLYAGSEATLQTAGGPVHVVQRTRYPWEGTVHVELHPEREREMVLALRLPGWAREQPVPSDLYRFADDPAPVPTLTVGGQAVTLTPGRHLLSDPSDGSEAAGEVVVADGFARVRRMWSPDGTDDDGGDGGVDLTLPMPVRRVAANPNVTADAGHLALQRGPVVYAAEGVDNGGSLDGLRLPLGGEVGSTWRPGLLGGIVTVSAPLSSGAADSANGHLLAIPYFAWANRGADEMAVWLPTGPAVGR